MRFYLADRGFPFLAVITAAEAAQLYEQAPADRRSGSVDDGFEVWQVLTNGLGRRIKFGYRVDPIPACELDAVARRVSRLGTVPAELELAAAAA